jgi:hypothetical protein
MVLKTFVFLVFVVIAAGCTVPGSSESAGEQNLTFSCENDSSVVSTRAYVYLRGFGDHSPGAIDYQKNLMNADTKVVGILDFDYDEQKSLQTISGEFVSQFNTFAAEHNPEEIIVIGQSAGGTVAAFSASQLNFSGKMEIHTMASPLRGYNLRGFMESFVGDRQGFGREIALGISPFIKPGNNVKSYHHKTVTDSQLTSSCGDFEAFCNAIDIQNNNLPGSKQFSYPKHDHTSIMRAVSKKIIDCHQ